MDNNYPGWVARVDAESRPIEAIYPASRAVAVPAGKHQVVLSYEPSSFSRGLITSGVTLFLVATTLGTCLLTRLRKSQVS
jgi:uncharacterized membrane protein YfhO